MKWLLIIGGAVAAVGLFLLATASGDTALFARHYPLLLGLNAALAALLAALVTPSWSMLARRHRARVFGARLTLRLLVRFAALAVLPGLIVYAVSVHVPHAVHRVLVRRQGRRRAGGRHQPRPAGRSSR